MGVEFHTIRFVNLKDLKEAGFNLEPLNDSIYAVTDEDGNGILAHSFNGGYKGNYDEDMDSGVAYYSTNYGNIKKADELMAKIALRLQTGYYDDNVEMEIEEKMEEIVIELTKKYMKEHSNLNIGRVSYIAPGACDYYVADMSKTTEEEFNKTLNEKILSVKKERERVASENTNKDNIFDFFSKTTENDQPF